MADTVSIGFLMLWRLAGCPTRTSPLSEKATMEGVVRPPSAFSITLALFPSITATQELVVPRSIPIAFTMTRLLASRPLQIVLHLYLSARYRSGRSTAARAWIRVSQTLIASETHRALRVGKGERVPQSRRL